MNSPHCDAMSLSDADTHSEQAASSSNAQNTTSRSTHTPKYLGVIDITTDEESDSDSSELPAITKRIDQIAKVSKSTILSFSALVFYSDLIIDI